MGNWLTIQPLKCNAMHTFYSLSVPQTNRWPRARTQSSQVKQAPTSIVCYVNVILDHLVLLLVDSIIFHQHDSFLCFCFITKQRQNKPLIFSIFFSLLVGFLLQNRSKINNGNVYIFYMFGTSLKTGINCFCFKKKPIIGTATLNFHMMKQEKILKWHSQIVFFFPKRNNIHIILQ